MVTSCNVNGYDIIGEPMVSFFIKGGKYMTDECSEDEYIKDDSKGTGKTERILGMYTRLMGGAVINKSEEALRYNVDERTIQRDISVINNYFQQACVEDGIINSVEYNWQMKGYKLEHVYKYKFTNPEILAICKILLDSRAFTKDEMMDMLEKLVDNCVPKTEQELIKKLIKNEEFHYVEPRHRTVFIDKMWEIGQAIRNCRYIEIDYKGSQSDVIKTRKLKPVAIMFSDMYFYMTAFLEDKEVRKNFSVIDDTFPTIYRIDRIQRLTVLDEHFKIPYADRFEEGEFRKRIQFMYGGKLRKIRFKYHGHNVEPILDRLPTAKIEKQEDDVFTISAEVFGDGVDMWIRSQGDAVEMLGKSI